MLKKISVERKPELERFRKRTNYILILKYSPTKKQFLYLKTYKDIKGETN